MATVGPTLLADQPEIMSLAQLAAVPASKIVGAFNDPEHFFDHLSLDELARIQSACQRQAAVQQRMLDAMEVYAEMAKTLIAELRQETGRTGIESEA